MVGTKEFINCESESSACVTKKPSDAGQKVWDEYQERSMKPIWHRIYVMDAVPEN